MSNAFTIRTMRLEDLQRVCGLNEQLGYTGSLDDMRERFEAIVRRQEQAVFVAEAVGEGVMAWLHAQARHSLETGSHVEIVGLVVSVEARRRGIGRALVRHAQSWTRDLGYPRLLVRTNVAREGAHDFYEALGFCRTKTQHVREFRVE
jgi:ribosomal protein S18 acetylase RimI-like enzyme